jgi:hypothetical protein
MSDDNESQSESRYVSNPSIYDNLESVDSSPSVDASKAVSSAGVADWRNDPEYKYLSWNEKKSSSKTLTHHGSMKGGSNIIEISGHNSAVSSTGLSIGVSNTGLSFVTENDIEK